MSEKKRKALGDRPVFSSISPSGKGVKRKKRTKSERERIYGPPGYVEWIHGQPCAACGVVGFSVCAHMKTGGMGRKDDWVRTFPLCGHALVGRTVGYSPSCHTLYDEHRSVFNKRFPDFNALEACKRCEAQWRESQA